MPQRPPSDLKRVTAQYHAAVQSLTQSALDDLQGRWQGVQATLDLKIKRLTDQIAAAQAHGETVNVAWLTQARRLEELRQAVQGDVSAFADGAADIVQQTIASAADLGQAAAQAALSATVPPGVNFTFGVPPSDVTETLAGALQPGAPLASLFSQIGPQVAAFAQQALFTGVALGENPRTIAQRLGWATNMAARRAEVIARTETMRAWRHAQFANYQANRDVVQQWMWAADFGPRCCGACIAMDGTFHSVDTELDDHICGRCSAIPITRPWSDILAGAGMSQSEIEALDLTETSGLAWAQSRESGESWLSRQSTEIQNQILGPAKAEAWRQGAFPLERVVGVVHDPQWGSSIRELSLKQMGIDAQTWLRAARQAGNDSVLADADALAAAHAETSVSVAAEQEAARVAEAKAAADEWYAAIERSIAEGRAGGLTAEEAKAAADEWFAQVSQHLPPGGLSTTDIAREMERRFGFVAEPAALEEAATEAAAAPQVVGEALTGDALRAEAAQMRETFRDDYFAHTEDYKAIAAADAARQQAFVETMDNNPEFERLVAASGHETFDFAGQTWTPEMQVISDIERSWGALVMDEVPMNVALRSVAQDLFGLELPARQIDAAVLDQAQELVRDYGSVLRTFVQTTYDRTQDWFAEQGITELMVYRGFTNPDPVEGLIYDGSAQSVSLAGAAFSSYSIDPQAAYNYAATEAVGYKGGDYHALLAERVPVSEVFATALTSGMPDGAEGEALIFGSARDAVAVPFQGDAAPALDTALDRLAGEIPATVPEAEAAASAAEATTASALGESAPTLTPEQIAAFEARDLTPMAGETGIINEADMAPDARANVDAETQRIVQAIHPEDMSAGAAKEQVARALGNALADNPEFAKIADAMADFWRRDLIEQGYSEAAADAGVAAMARDPEQIASALIKAWADGQGTLPPALQQAIRDEFNLKAASRLPNSALVKQARAEWAEVQPGLRAFVREMYNQTQQWFADNGITEVPLYRGMGWEKLPKWMDARLLDGLPHEVTVPLRAASSFSVDSATALTFAQSPVSDAENINYQQVIALRVPAAAILATPQTGFGALEEYEAVVLGGRYTAIGIGVDNSVVSESSNIDEILANYHELTYEQIGNLLAKPTPKEPPHE